VKLFKCTSALMLIVLGFTIFVIHNTSAATTALGNLVASMQPGTWAQLSTNNINATLSNPGGASGIIFGYTEYIKWDPVGHRLYYLGGDHFTSGTPVMRHVQYDENSNSWSILPEQSWFTAFSSHGYDHGAIDPVHRYFYFRPPGNLTMYRWNMDTRVWTAMPSNNVIGFDSCCVGIDYFPELHGVIWASDENDDNGGVTRLNDATGQWERIAQAAAYPMGDYHNFAEYNPVRKVMVFGGGTGGKATRQIYKLDATGAVTPLKKAPTDLGIQDAIFTVDPVSGDYLVFTKNSQFYVYNVVTDTWTLKATGSSIPIWTTSYGDPVHGVVAGPIDTYGVNVFVTCDGTNKCSVNLYKHSTGNSSAPPDNGPPVDGTTTTSGTPAAPGTPPTNTSSTPFAVKCAQAGVINCFGFESASALNYTWPAGTSCDAVFAGQTNNFFGTDRRGAGNAAAVIQNGQCVYPQIDTATSHSGSGTMKFTIPPNSDANSSGFFTEPFKRNSNGTFPYVGPGSSLGSVLYFQFYQKFDSNFVNTDYQCMGGECAGWKQAIWYGNPPNGASSSSLEVTMNNGWQRNVPQMYGQSGTDDYGIEDAINCTYAKATSQGGSGSGFNSRPNYQSPLNPTCFHFPVDQWVEFTGRIEIRGAANAPASRVQLWVNGQPAIDYGAARINWSGPDGNGLGQFLLTPYHTNKDPNRATPAGYTWYDDLVISTQPIAMSSGTTSPPPVSTTPPPAGSGNNAPPDKKNPSVSITSPENGSSVSGTIQLSAEGSDNVRVVGVQFLVDGNPLGNEVKTAPYGISWETTAAANGSHKLTAVARDAAGNMTTSKSVSVTVNNTPATPMDNSVAFVQGAAETDDDTSKTIAGTFSKATATGNLIVVAVSWGNRASVSCKDTQGNTYAVATTQYDSANNQSLAICYAANIKGGSGKITATFSNAAPYRRILIHEYRGIALTSPVDAVSKNIADGTTAANAITTNSVTTTASGDLVFGAIMDDTGVNRITAGTGFTLRQSVNNKDLVSEDRLQALNGPVAATSTFSARHRYLAQMVAFKHR